MRTAYITHADCLKHEMGTGHPECPDRLRAVDEHIAAAGLLPELLCLQAPLAAAVDLKRVHGSDYVDHVFDHAPSAGLLQLDPDTAMNAHSLQAALRAAGSGLLAVDEVMAGRCQNAFCAVRPCGHHATQIRSMGFCIFNNVSVAAAYALRRHGLERVAVIDFDVHHGNGTEDMFSSAGWQPQVLMTGFFQHPFYPYSGTAMPAPNMVNVPLAAGSGSAAVKRAVTQDWLPALEQFRPQMLFISAGFDAHREDLLGGMALEESDYVWITQQLMAVAERHAGKRIVSLLEGGYNLSALGRSATAHIKTLAS